MSRPVVLRRCACGQEFPTAIFRSHLPVCAKVEVNGKVYDKKMPVTVHPKKRSDSSIAYSVMGSTPTKQARADFEILNVGSEAWVSWDGHTAWPCVITRAVYKDDTQVPPGYSVVPIGLDPKWKRRAGSYPSRFKWTAEDTAEHALFREEVRSTPELACRSFVSL